MLAVSSIESWTSTYLPTYLIPFLKKQASIMRTSFGSLPRLYDPQHVDRCSLPGPGEYNISSVAAGKPYKKRKKKKKNQQRIQDQPERPAQKIRALVLNDGKWLPIKPKCKKVEKEDSRCETDKPCSTFGVGRDSCDPWGRNVLVNTPGPGSYHTTVSGTFDDLRKDNQNECAERTFLKSVCKRLDRLQELREKHDEGGLGITEKVLFRQESRPHTVKRLSGLKSQYEDDVLRIAKERKALSRPRTTPAWTYKALSGVSIEGSCFGIKQADRSISGLLSNYSFVAGGSSSSGGNPFFQSLSSSMTCSSSSGTLVEKSSAYGPEDHAPNQVELDEQDDQLYPVPCTDGLAPRRLRAPSFWSKQHWDEPIVDQEIEEEEEEEVGLLGLLADK